MPYCSFKVKSPGVLPIPGQLNALDEGLNTFTALVPDVEAFKAELRAMGVEVLEVFNLDEHEPYKPSLDLLPEEAADLEQHLRILGTGKPV